MPTSSAFLHALPLLVKYLPNRDVMSMIACCPRCKNVILSSESVVTGVLSRRFDDSGAIVEFMGGWQKCKDLVVVILALETLDRSRVGSLVQLDRLVRGYHKECTPALETSSGCVSRLVTQRLRSRLGNEVSLSKDNKIEDVVPALPSLAELKAPVGGGATLQKAQQKPARQQKIELRLVRYELEQIPFVLFGTDKGQSWSITVPHDVTPERLVRALTKLRSVAYRAGGLVRGMSFYDFRSATGYELVVQSEAREVWQSHVMLFAALNMGPFDAMFKGYTLFLKDEDRRGTATASFSLDEKKHRVSCSCQNFAEWATSIDPDFVL